MSTRRITIARDGEVRLNGRATRWRVRRISPDAVWAYPQSGPLAFFAERMASARAYLAALTDAELMG
jgi:squalene cyclase